MRKINNKTIFVLISIIFYLFLSLILLIKNLGDNYFKIVNPIFWGILFFISFIFFRKEYVNKKNRYDVLLNVIICIVIFFVVYYLIGFIIGFQNTPYNNSLKGIFYNFWQFGTIIIFQEFIRMYLINRTGKDKSLLFLIMLLFILTDISDAMISHSFDDFEKVFKFIVITLNPAIAKHALLTYLTYNADYIPSLFYRMVMEMFSFIVPFVPNFNWFFIGVINIVFPFIVFVTCYNLFKKRENIKEYKRNYKSTIFYLPVIIITGILIILVSGLFKYQAIAIASNSMNPEFYRGDALVLKKITKDNISEIDVGQTIAFEYNGAIVVHRIIEKVETTNGVYAYRTKGDNNEAPDPNLVSSSQVLGKHVLTIKFIGFPSVYLQEFLTKNK